MVRQTTADFQAMQRVDWIIEKLRGAAFNWTTPHWRDENRTVTVRIAGGMEHQTALEDELKQVQEELGDVQQKWVNQNMLLELRAHRLGHGETERGTF